MRSARRFTGVLMLIGMIASLRCSAAEPEALRVGAILPLTGDAAGFGVGAKNGMEFAYQKLPPDVRARLKITYEDDAFQPKNSITAFNRLRQDGRLDVLVNAGSQTGKALAPLAEQARIPLIAIASDPEIVAGRKYVVNFWVTPQTEIEAVLPYAAKQGYKKIARIATMHDFPLAIKNAFDAANRGKIGLVLDEEYPTEVRDFRPFITRLAAHKDADAVLAILMPGQIGTFARQLREMGSRLPMFGFEFFEDPAEVTASAGALVGQWYVNAADPEGSFQEQFARAFPQGPVFAAPNGHDIVMLLAAAVQGDLRGDALNLYLHTVKDFTGAMGKFSASGQNTFTLPAAIKIVGEKGFKEVKP